MSKKKSDFMKEWISFPLDLQDELLEAIEESTAETAEEFAWEILVGPCPKCGNDKTRDCEGIAGIDDPTVGLCKRCGFSWCSECGASLGPNIICGHWEICESCGNLKDEDGLCGYATLECDIIQKWLFSKSPQETEDYKDN
jgi:hypothetical protein